MTSEVDELLARLRTSRFRSRFHLDAQSRAYLQSRGLPVVMEHAAAFLRERLVPARPPKDGKQTPMRGHPVFIAQHATGSCCRSCLAKWHHIEKNAPLTEQEQMEILAVIRAWLEREALERGIATTPDQGQLF
ncbi:DUF4186 domain-containing protein [Kozakia baliensis]|uniref:DUF4186 domain-containing protein n=1 Tax=Kozakia baliensis TaxID=153496 RepID=A0A1D8UQR5_9PROT|nr:DUF4186 domain-containing protein [Kozakia baliensis]AOX15979.1 DUF4186 domain-containing protein [Kozakia baliensis]GBR27293.1 hypothetical protein AA0488_1096 [Kozakia baliensis NRIC 0488]GEL64122.1 DUF4186 domain-containing protein [Kozakia baliensis]